MLTHGDVEVASWPLVVDGGPGLAVVDDLGRLQLAARRAGYSIRLCDLSRDLSELLELTGLTALFGLPG